MQNIVLIDFEKFIYFYPEVISVNMKNHVESTNTMYDKTHHSLKELGRYCILSWLNFLRSQDVLVVPKSTIITMIVKLYESKFLFIIPNRDFY